MQCSGGYDDEPAQRTIQTASNVSTYLAISPPQSLFTEFTVCPFDPQRGKLSGV